MNRFWQALRDATKHCFNRMPQMLLDVGYPRKVWTLRIALPHDLQGNRLCLLQSIFGLVVRLASISVDLTARRQIQGQGKHPRRIVRFAG